MHRWLAGIVGLGLVLGCAGLQSEKEGDAPGECTDKADNDANGKFDCDDPACAGAPDCRAAVVTDESLQAALCTSVSGIASAQLAHEAASHSFIEARPSPRSLDALDTNSAPWKDAGGFSDLGWRPAEQDVRSTWWTESEGRRFAAYGAARGGSGELLCCVVSGEAGGSPGAPVRTADACRASLHGFGSQPTSTARNTKFVAVSTDFKECARNTADCQRVSCLVANTGTEGGTTTVTATWTRRNGTQQQSSETVFVPAGETFRQGFRFTDVHGGNFTCSVSN